MAPVGGGGMLRDVYVTWGHSLSAGIWVMHFLHLLVEWLARVKMESVWIMLRALWLKSTWRQSFSIARCSSW
jgi:hypothetical protein